MATLRVQKADGSWLPLAVQVVSRAAGVEVDVPAWGERWVLTPGGMVGNVGGNAWAIYTCHPDDCTALCAKVRTLPDGRRRRSTR